MIRDCTEQHVLTPWHVRVQPSVSPSAHWMREILHLKKAFLIIYTVAIGWMFVRVFYYTVKTPFPPSAPKGKNCWPISNFRKNKSFEAERPLLSQCLQTRPARFPGSFSSLPQEAAPSPAVAAQAAGPSSGCAFAAVLPAAHSGSSFWERLGAARCGGALEPPLGALTRRRPSTASSRERLQVSRKPRAAGRAG